MKIKAPPFRPLDFTMLGMMRLDFPKYTYFSIDTSDLTDAPKERHVEIAALLAEIRGIAGVSQDALDECWTKMLRTFPASAPLTLARALKSFLLEYGKLPVIT